LAPPVPQTAPDNIPLGMLWYGTSSFFFAGMGICSKLLGHYHYPVWEITLVRAVVILSCCLSVLFRAGTLQTAEHLKQRLVAVPAWQSSKCTSQLREFAFEPTALTCEMCTLPFRCHLQPP
jgi:hypothetical protein